MRKSDWAVDASLDSNVTFDWSPWARRKIHRTPHKRFTCFKEWNHWDKFIVWTLGVTVGREITFNLSTIVITSKIHDNGIGISAY